METIIISQSIKYHDVSKILFADFQNHLPHLRNINLEFTSDVFFGQDIANLNDHRIVDNSPAVLSLSDNFFEDINCIKLSERQLGVLLHEIGHFYTNPKLIPFHNLLHKYHKIVDSVNLNESFYGGISRIIKFPKLIEEVCCEKWFYEKEQQIYNNNIVFREMSIFSENFGDPVDCFYLLLWKEVLCDISEEYDYEKMKGCIDADYVIFNDYLKQHELRNLNLFTYKSEILNSIHDQNYHNIIGVYLKILDEYIDFKFPKLSDLSLRFKIKNFYGI